MGERQLRELHKPRPEKMLDEDKLIEGATDDDAAVDAMVCDHCFGLVYPDGPDDYVDPDVFYPCPTIKALDSTNPGGA